ncbi:amidohydrolase [Luteimonas sp. RIT-PG2_3]
MAGRLSAGTPSWLQRVGWTTALVALLAACQPAADGASAASGAAPASAQAAELVFTNGRIHTVDDAQPWAEAVAIRDGRIVAVGNADEVKGWTGPQTRVVDLQGRLVLPSFGDAHVHPVFGGMSFSRCSLHKGQSIEDYRRIITDCVAQSPGNGTVYGIGWQDGLFPPDGVPRKEVLDAISSERPLIFMSVGGHSLWLNSKALEVAGIDRKTPNPENGVIDRDPATGEAVGGLQESAMDLVAAQIPEPTQKEMEDAIAYAARHFNSLGITHWHDANVAVLADGNSDVVKAYAAVRDRGELSVDVTMALGWQNGVSMDQLPLIRKASAQAKALDLDAHSVKLYLDGVIVQKTAAMLAPYQDSGDERGQTQIPEDVLNQVVAELDAHGMQAHIHSIGDRAVRLALDAIGGARERNGPRDNRHMVSHLNVIDPADQPRFGELGAVAVFQPLWACDEPYMRLSIERIGPQRKPFIYPTRGVMAAGGKVAYGSDWPVASANPLEGIEVALTRIAPGVTDLAPLGPEQRIELADAIKAYTLNVAYVNRIDQDTGSITAGKRADLVVLDRDLFKIPANEISKAKVLLTLYRGKPVSGDLALDAR